MKCYKSLWVVIFLPRNVGGSLGDDFGRVHRVIIMMFDFFRTLFRVKVQ